MTGTTTDRTTWMEVQTIATLIGEDPISSLTSGTWHTCASVPYEYEESGLWCWGANNLGQAGIGAAPLTTTPTRIINGAPGAVGSQDGATCVVVSLRIECFGFNGSGGLGDGTTTNSDVPVPIEPLVADLDMEAATGCQIRVDRTLWCWGYNLDGQLGLGDTANRDGPTQLAGVAALDVATGVSVSCYVSLTELLHCAGDTYGATFDFVTSGAIRIDIGSQLYDPHSEAPSIEEEICRVGDTNGIACASPGATFLQVGTDLDWESISTSASHRCGIRLNGTLWCMGENDHGQLGLGDTTDRPSMVQVGTDTDWAIVDTQVNPTDTSTPDHEGITCGVKDDGTLWCWGFGGDAQLGLGADLTDKSTPTQVGTATDWTTVSVGADHACGVRGVDAYCWGANARGQLGTGSTTAEASPTLVASTYFDVFDISAGWEATIASTEFR